MRSPQGRIARTHCVIGWIDQVNMAPVADALSRLGIEFVRVGSDVSFQCLVCRDLPRNAVGNSRPRIARVTSGGDGWRCGACGADGSTFGLVALVAVNRASDHTRAELAEVRRLARTHGLCDVNSRSADQP